MNLLNRFRDARRTKAVRVTQELGNQLFVNPLCSDYENVFAQVQPLINDMKVVRPFGVGKNGGKLPLSKTPELAKLDTPNNEMGWAEFAETMFSTWLTEDELDIHVHLNNGKVIGYSILPPSSRIYLGNGEWQWESITQDGTIILTRDEVMRLRFSRSPKDIQRGISPATAIRAWAQTEDVLAQYQRAYIENGAIPASITFIRASSQERFKEVKKELESNLRGASNKGKTIYVWRQFDNGTGEQLDTVEVKTIQGNNSTLAIKELADIINDHLNKAYGVSNFILGDDSSAKYDNAELSDYQFIKRRVFPALMAFWDQFQFELDRITGGIGYAIQFELELPDLTERQKVRAEIAEKNVINLLKLIEAGARPDASLKALNLGDNWADAARGVYLKKLTGGSQNDTSKKSCIHCGSCDHLNRKASPVSTKDELPELTPNERKIYDQLISLARKIFAEDPNINTEDIVNKIVEVLDEEAIEGETTGAEALQLLADKDIANEIRSTISEGLSVSRTLQDRIIERTNQLVDGYSQDTKRIFNDVLNNSEGLSAGEIQHRLREVLPTWQARRIARNETVYAFKSGRLDEDKSLSSKYGIKVRLIWRTSEDQDVCPVCAAMNGKTTSLGEAFVDRVETEDGVMAWEHSFWNDNGQVPDAHVNCRCYFDEVLEDE